MGPSPFSFEGYTDAECQHKTNIRCPLSYKQVEFARVETGLAIMLPG
jgi:hypothetical protein